MSIKVPCSKCGREFTTQGIKNHELRCDGTIPESKEPITFSEPSNDVIEHADETTGSETYTLRKSNPESKPEHRIDEQRFVQKSDVGLGAVVLILLILAGLYLLISKLPDVISKIPRKEIVKEEKPNHVLTMNDLRG